MIYHEVHKCELQTCADKKKTYKQDITMTLGPASTQVYVNWVYWKGKRVQKVRSSIKKLTWKKKT